MQNLTDDQIAVLRSPQQFIQLGLELLDSNDVVVEDISKDFGRAGSIQHQNYADIHGTCNNLIISRKLNWGVDRIKPYISISSGHLTERFNLGVYIPTTPTRPVGSTTTDYSVNGYDKLFLLQRSLGESYYVAAGTPYLAAIDAVIVASGITGLTVDIDQSSVATLPEDMVWAMDADNPVSWLSVINDLLFPIGYQGLWCDLDGVLRSGPYISVTNRMPEWMFDVADRSTNIVFQDRTVDVDEFDGFNWWRFVRKNNFMTPTEGFGLYTVDRSGGGEKYKRVMYLDAADQASLVTLGDRQVDLDSIRTQTVKIKTGPLPAMGHFDVFDYIDPDIGTLKAMSRSWSIDLSNIQSSVELEVIS